jgi:hypothetical protein
MRGRRRIYGAGVLGIIKIIDYFLICFHYFCTGKVIEVGEEEYVQGDTNCGTTLDKGIETGEVASVGGLRHRFVDATKQTCKVCHSINVWMGQPACPPKVYHSCKPSIAIC